MLQERIQRAQWLLHNIKHAAMATVNADGTPHNTPYLFMISDDLQEIYWGSSPKSLHSHNVERTGNVFVVLYESDQGGGLYIQAKQARVAVNEELERALSVHNGIRTTLGKDPLLVEYYTGDAPQRMYIANIEKFWVNYAERDETGKIIQDIRNEVSVSELLG